MRNVNLVRAQLSQFLVSAVEVKENREVKELKEMNEAIRLSMGLQMIPGGMDPLEDPSDVLSVVSEVGYQNIFEIQESDQKQIADLRTSLIQERLRNQRLEEELENLRKFLAERNQHSVELGSRWTSLNDQFAHCQKQLGVVTTQLSKEKQSLAAMTSRTERLARDWTVENKGHCAAQQKLNALVDNYKSLTLSYQEVLKKNSTLAGENQTIGQKLCLAESETATLKSAIASHSCT